MFKPKSVLSVVAMLTMMAVAPYAAADTGAKIGFINLQRVSNEAPQALRAMKKIKGEFEKRDQDLQKMSKQLQTLQDKLDKDGPTLSDNDRKQRERELSDLNRDFQRKQREFREDLSVRQNEELTSLYETVNKVIRKIAETEKYDLIVQEAVYYSPNIDITNKVLKALGADVSAAPTTGAPMSMPVAPSSSSTSPNAGK
ncbi:MAG TPA: OmpH family outer membrane protein [Rhodocyclaceae bacterium]|nr:OmpH family outer membrane protein [Rhodocyclaceae bacterium]